MQLLSFFSLLSCIDLSKQTEETEQDIVLDVLFVIDNSASMVEETSALGLHVASFLSSLDGVDLQLGITTTSVDISVGATAGLDPGEAGLLLGTPSIITGTKSQAQENIQRNLLCDSVYWDSEMMALENQDVDYVCGEEPEFISVQYLDCLCGVNEWENTPGSGQEEPLEAALLALCRGSDDPPEVCYDEISGFASSESETNEGFIREDSDVVVIFLGDEGDSSRRLNHGDADPSIYETAFEQFGKSITFFGMGPNIEVADTATTMRCNDGGATEYGALRIKKLSNRSGGSYFPLAVEEGDCVLGPIGDYLDDISDSITD